MDSDTDLAAFDKAALVAQLELIAETALADSVIETTEIRAAALTLTRYLKN